MNLESRTLTIGTRGSQLALWQANHVAERLRAALPGLPVRLETIRTTGDRILDAPLARVGGKALFVKEIEEALLDRRVDLAVHSMKDVPTDLPAGLAIVAVTEREDPLDVLISPTGARLTDLPAGARVGTSSLRRQAQLLYHRPDLTIVPLRGNLDTRLRKLNSEGLDAIVLAAAGVKRLGWTHRITEFLPPEVCLPAIGQGALGVEVREPRATSREPSGGANVERGTSNLERETSNLEQETWNVERVVMILDHRETHLAVRTERAMLRRLGGGCQVPIAAWATVEGEAILLRGLIAGTDGGALVRGEARGTTADPDGLGAAMAEDLLARGGRAILDRIAEGGVHD